MRTLLLMTVGIAVSACGVGYGTSETSTAVVTTNQRA
jgi:hypothetical protein